MEVLKIIMPIVIGGVIGYFTNFIAIKMLFHPYRQIKIGKFKLPFTPGIIPKNQGRMAESVGNAVSSQLFTSEDIVGSIINEETKKEITEKITDMLFTSDISLSKALGEEDVENNEFVRSISDGMSNKICFKLLETDMKPVIRGVLSNILKENKKIGLFVSFLPTIEFKIEEGIKQYIEENGQEFLGNYILDMIKDIYDKPLNEAIAETGVERERVLDIVGKGFDILAKKVAEELPKRIDIGRIITEKINAFEVAQLEDLLMQVMKNELQAVINLGAVLGAIIGAVNIFI
jgi:uncharacterized membrane protein YheB (UPF0754 family)